VTLNLDLSSSEAKVDRAFEHLEALEREAPAEYEKDGPYSVRFSQVDPETGWCEVFLVPNPKKPRFGVLVGDIMHNLRCALDYIVTALADASGADPETKRGWPFHIKRPQFRGEVIDRHGMAKPGGPLAGITHGLGLIEQLQPYRTQPNPRLDPLFVIYRFSNADKHREVAETVPYPVGQLDLSFNGIVVETEPILETTNWTPDQDVLVHRMRLDPPVAYNMRAKGALRIRIGFFVPPFRSEPLLVIYPPLPRKCCEDARGVVEAFKLL
jgi:hypothetical protein